MDRFGRSLLAGAILVWTGAGVSMAQGAEAAVPAPADAAAVAAPAPAPEPVIESTGDPALDAAIKDARASLDHFWTHAEKFPGQEHWHIVKIGLPATAGGKETVWVYTTEKQGNHLKGVIVTQPDGLVGGLRKGSKVEFSGTDIIDWSYDDKGLRRGEYTKRAEFADLTPAEIAEELAFEDIHPDPVP